MFFISTQKTYAIIDPNCYSKGTCLGSDSSPSSSPSVGNEIRLNPAAVPTEKGFGLETIYYNDAEWSIVQGLGRAGAAISPANSEETFFGPPSVELNSDYLQRHLDHDKYKSQKYTLSTAFKITKKTSKKNSLKLNLGVMAKYNKFTKNITPGGGLAGSFGPVQFGGSYYLDETQLSPELDDAARPTPTRYKVQTYNIGLYLTSIILSYSYLQMNLENGDTQSINSVLTASLFYNRFIFNLAGRIENSSRQWYNPDSKLLESKQIKNDYFGGIQVRLNKNIMLGSFYNYYLLNEFSTTLTLFF